MKMDTLISVEKWFDVVPRYSVWKIYQFQGSGCATGDRLVTSDPAGPMFESSQYQLKVTKDLFSVTCTSKILK